MNRKNYRVADGVTRINGAPVPASRRVSLTDAEALYERALGRLAPEPHAEPGPAKRRGRNRRAAAADPSPETAVDIAGEGEDG